MPTSERIEKAARAVMIEDGCGLTINGVRTLCDEASCGDAGELSCMCRNAAKVALSAAEGVKPREWEAFCDASYYDMWCVRPVGEAEFGKGFHLINGDEAKELARILAALQEGV